MEKEKAPIATRDASPARPPVVWEKCGCCELYNTRDHMQTLREEDDMVRVCRSCPRELDETDMSRVCSKCWVIHEGWCKPGQDTLKNCVMQELFNIEEELDYGTGYLVKCIAKFCANSIE